MISILKHIKKTKFWSIVIDYLIYPIYHFIWSYIINFNGKLLYFLWSLKNKEFFSLNNNDKLIVDPSTDSKKISHKILEESKLFIENSKKEILSKEYSEAMSKTSLADGEKPYRISIYEKLSDNLKKEIVQFASSEKLVTTASEYMKVFPILTRVQVYYNIPRKEVPLRGAMFWHKDGFGFKNLDFFMCVTDVDDSNGPFYCLEKKINAGIFKSFDYFFKKTGERNKVNLENFDKKFKADEILEFKGKSGKAIFLDSFSTFHRGGFCKEKERIMLRFWYQTHDAICDELDSNKDYFLFDFSTTKNNTRDVFKKYLFFKKPPIFLKFLKKQLIKFYYIVEYRYKI